MYDESTLIFLQGREAPQPKGPYPNQHDNEGYEEAVEDGFAIFELICYHFER